MPDLRNYGSDPEILNIPSYNYETLFANEEVRKKNSGNINDGYIRDRLEIDYSTRHKTVEFTQFNRYFRRFPDEELTTLIPYVFFVRPDLNILNSDMNDVANNQIRGDGTMRWLYNNVPEVIKSLSADYTQYHDYIPYLGNHVETFPSFDYTLLTSENTQMFTGYRNYYAGNAIQSTSGIQFDITFREDKNLSTTKLFFAWTYYIDGVVRNKFPAKWTYRINRIADYYTSIYYFLCEPDGQKITYYQKIVGAFPTNTPFSVFGMNLPMQPENKISISFSAFSVEHLNPIILSEFNYNSRLNREGEWSRPNTGRSLHPISHYDPILMTGQTFVGTPYVYSDDGQNYYLMWNNV